MHMVAEARVGSSNACWPQSRSVQPCGNVKNCFCFSPVQLLPQSGTPSLRLNDLRLDVVRRYLLELPTHRQG